MGNWLLDHLAKRVLVIDGAMGTSTYNYDLSARRASTVVDHLIAGGIDRNRLLFPTMRVHLSYDPAKCRPRNQHKA